MNEVSLFTPCSEVTAALAPAAQLRLISAAGCGLEALERHLAQFAAHPYLRVSCAPDG